MARTARLVAGWLALFAISALAQEGVSVAPLAPNKQPQVTCQDPGQVPLCVDKTPTPTRTVAPPTPTRTATLVPTVAPTATTVPTAIATATPSADVTSPTVKILSPLSGAVVPDGALQVTVEASDNVGVTKVEFYHDGGLVGTKNSAPWVATYQNVQQPAATIGVWAYDAAGNKAYAENNITVQPPLSTPTPAVATPTATPATQPSPTVAPTTVPTPGAAGTPIPPQAFVDTTVPAVTGVNRIVNAGQSFQTALDAAQPGDAITLQAGATFSGKFMVRVKPVGAPIWIRGSQFGALPEGVRVVPGDSAKLAKIQNTTTEPPIVFEPGASNYRFTGVEITTTWGATTATLNSLVWLGIDPVSGGSVTSLAQLPDNVIFDRVYLHGTRTGNLRRGITANTRSFAIIDSTIDEIHEQGADSQAVGGWNAAGPFKIANNHFEAAGEVIMWGGADAAIANLTPSDFVIENNEFEWPARWQAAVSGGAPASPQWDGSTWSLKNLFEMKHAQRMLVRNNRFIRWWVSGQVCPLMFTVRNQNGTNPWATVRDVDFVDNYAEQLGPGTCIVNMFGADSPPPSGGGDSLQTVRMRFRDNYFDTQFGLTAFRILGGVDSLRVEHNTIATTPNGGSILALDRGHGPNTNMVMRDNIATIGKYGVTCSNTGGGDIALNTCAPGVDFRGNLIYGPWPSSGGATQSQLAGHPGNFYPADQAAVGIDSATHMLAPSSPWKGKATDGTDAGITTAK